MATIVDMAGISSLTKYKVIVVIIILKCPWGDNLTTVE
jgi:hypothetical protein